MQIFKILFLFFYFGFFYIKQPFRFIHKISELHFFCKFLGLQLYIAVLNITPYSKRIYSLFEAWGNEYVNSSNIFKIYTAYNESAGSVIPTKYWKIVKINKTTSVSYRNAFYLNFASAHDFYENTLFKWYLRTTYDNFIHLQHLYHYINELNKKYNPFKDIVMKGDHIRYFIHGGPGWIMSRAAVKEYLNMEKDMTHTYDINYSGDDVNIMMFPRKFNLSYKNIHTPEFSGWPVMDSSYQSLISSNFNYSNISILCNSNLQSVKVNTIIIWHNGRKKDYVNTIGKKIIDEAPDYLGLHYRQHIGGEFCIFKEKSKPKVKKIIIVRRRRKH